MNNPSVGLVTPETDRDADGKSCAHDPHLAWSGKAEHTSVEVPTVSLHVHERIDPRTIIEAVRNTKDTEAQGSLFATPGENPPLCQAIEFYRHQQNWTNRLIVSLPIEAGEHGRAAVKIVDDRGVESLKIVELTQ